MIRRDYLLRSIEQCIQALSRILKLTEEGEFAWARRELDQVLQAFVGLDARKLASLSDTELLAHLLQGEPSQALWDKGLLLVAMFERAGDLHAAENLLQESHACFLRALNLQLQILAREGERDLPPYSPTVEGLCRKLQESGAVFPPQTNLALMQYFERSGQFSKAEDILFTALESSEQVDAWINFGAQFYDRLLHRSDRELDTGDLPRAEVEAGLAELKKWRMDGQ